MVSEVAMRVLLVMKMKNKWEIKRVDIKEEFLNADLKEKIYVKMPKGWTETGGRLTDKVGILHKALYGLKQASRAFFDCIRDTLINLGFEQDKADCCLFKGQDIMIANYVDDLLVTGTKERMENFIMGLKRRYDLRIDDELTEFVGMELCWETRQRLKCCSRRY